MSSPARNDTKVWLVGVGFEHTAKYMAPCGVTVVICDKVRPDTFVITDWETAREYVRALEGRKGWESLPSEANNHEDHWADIEFERSKGID